MNITDFQKRKLKDFYVAIYVVSKEITIKTETCIANRNVYVFIGLDLIGNRQILGMYFENEADNRFWLEKFEDFKARGIRRILFFVTPKSKNIERCIKIIYNDISIIHSPDEIYSSVVRFFAERPSRKLQISFKDLFFCKDCEEFETGLEMFKERYIDNKLMLTLLNVRQEQIKEFYQYNLSLRKVLYPHYLIREIKKNLNKLKNRDVLCSSINDVIEVYLPQIQSFEYGRSYSKSEWLDFMSEVFEEYDGVLEEYING